MQPELWKNKIVDIKVEIEKLKEQKVTLGERLENLKVDTKAQNNGTLAAGMVNQELSSLLKMQEIINQKLEQLNFETKQDVYRISQHDRAGVPKVASNNKRLKYMAAAPVGILFLLLGVFLLVEVKAERVADPDALSIADAVGGLCAAAAADGPVDPQTELPRRRTTRSSNSSSGSTTCGSRFAATRRTWRRGAAC